MEYAIIAAGKGERLAQEGSTVPKPLTPLLGTPLIDRLLALFSGMGAGRIHVIVNGQSRELVQHLSELPLSMPLQLTVKDTESSLHSLAELIRSGLRDEVCLTTVDTVFNPDEFENLVSAFQHKPGLDALMGVTSFVDDEKPLYVRTNADLEILSFDDTRHANQVYVSGGIYCLRRKALECALKAVDSGVSRMRNFQRQLLTEGLAVEAFPFTKIVDVDHLDDIAVAERLLLD